MSNLQTYLNENLQPELHGLAMSWVRSSLKVDGSYNPAGTKWHRYSTPAQDAAVTRAENRLVRAWKAMNPKAVMVMFGEETADCRPLYVVLQGALKVAKEEGIA